jgi:hypothetical protein
MKRHLHGGRTGVLAWSGPAALLAESLPGPFALKLANLIGIMAARLSQGGSAGSNPVGASGVAAGHRPGRRVWRPGVDHLSVSCP